MSRKLLVVLTLGLLLLSTSCVTMNPRPWTTEEKIALGLSVVATAADAYTTMEILDTPGGYEMNPMLGRHPSDEKVVVFLGLSEVLTALVAHYIPDWRLGILAGKAAVNGHAAWRNQQVLKEHR